jgi:hypothetical protein
VANEPAPGCCCCCCFANNEIGNDPDTNIHVYVLCAYVYACQQGSGITSFVDKRPRKLNEFEKLENLLQFKGCCEKLSMQFNIDPEEYLGGEVEVIVPCLLGKYLQRFGCVCVPIFPPSGSLF